MRALRFFYTTRPDAMPRPEAAELLGQLLGDGQMLDLTVEELRRWQCWTHTDRILALAGTGAGQKPFARHAILCYALACPTPSAARFVAQQRRADPKLVSECEAALKAEGRPVAGG